MKRLVILFILLSTSIVKAEMLDQEQTVIKAITSAHDNNLESFIKYVRLVDIHSFNGRDYPPFKLLKFLKKIDPDRIKVESASQNIVVISNGEQKIEFMLRYIANENIRDEKQYVVSRVRVIK